MQMRRWFDTLSLVGLGLVFLFTACDDPPPPGPDLVIVSCFCHDGCAGGMLIEIPGQVCTDASNEANLQTAKEFVCGKKETIGFNVCKIEDCSPTGFVTVRAQGCPNGSGDFYAGDWGQSLAFAVPPSKVDISGDDINDFSVSPEEFRVETTQDGSSLFLASVSGSLADTTFTTDGIFGDDEHSLSEGILLARPFTVDLQPDGSYAIPPGPTNFIISGLVDGSRLALFLTSINLGGVYDEEGGVFTLTGNVDAVGADITLDVDFVLEFDNRPPDADAGADQVVECDAPGTATVHLSAAGTTDPDGPADLAHFTWYVDDVQAATGAEVDVAIALGTHEIKLVVADQRGSFDAATAMVTVEDMLPPVIDIVEPEAIEYVHSATIVLDYAVTDVCTGVDTVTPKMDGAEMLAGHGLADGQPIHLLLELPLGDHTFSVDATDNAGNASSASVTFSIVVTPESIQEAVVQLYESGHITHPGDGTFLLKKLQAAAKAYHKGNCNAARGQYGAFINTVEAQTGKTIDPVAAAILIADAQFLIDNCPQLFAQNEGQAIEPDFSERFPFVRGDADDNGAVNVSDVIFTLGYLFQGGAEPACAKAVDADDDGEIVISDAAYLLNHLFVGSVMPKAPYPDCGVDPTADLLDCFSLGVCRG